MLPVALCLADILAFVRQGTPRNGGLDFSRGWDLRPGGGGLLTVSDILLLSPLPSLFPVLVSSRASHFTSAGINLSPRSLSLHAVYHCGVGDTAGKLAGGAEAVDPLCPGAQRRKGGGTEWPKRFPVGNIGSAYALSQGFRPNTAICQARDKKWAYLTGLL